jgi:hypothetical protein
VSNNCISTSIVRYPAWRSREILQDFFRAKHCSLAAVANVLQQHCSSNMHLMWGGRRLVLLGLAPTHHNITAVRCLNSVYPCNNDQGWGVCARWLVYTQLYELAQRP